MSLTLTPEMLAAAYELLRTTQPFKRWKLPPADEVSFAIFSNNSHSADYYRHVDGKHRIRVNANWIGSVSRLMVCVAHEMVHLHLRETCRTDCGQHGPRFKRAAAQVCKHHALDHKGF